MIVLQLGTGLGIFISKRNPSLVATFCVLSCGYLVSSFNEVKSDDPCTFPFDMLDIVSVLICL